MEPYTQKLWVGGVQNQKVMRGQVQSYGLERQGQDLDLLGGWGVKWAGWERPKIGLGWGVWVRRLGVRRVKNQKTKRGQVQSCGLEHQGQDLDLQGQVLDLLEWGGVGCGVGSGVGEEGKEVVHGLH